MWLISPLSHEGYVDTISSGNSSKWNKPADDRGETLQGWDIIRCQNQTDFHFICLFIGTAKITVARDLSPKAVTTAPVVALT